MQTHTSREIAQAMVDRVFTTLAHALPRPVALAPQECQTCGGDGKVLQSPSPYPEDPRAELVTCDDCHGEGSAVPYCDVCGKRPATTWVACGDPCLAKFCEGCATRTYGLDGLDFAVAFALRHLP